MAYIIADHMISSLGFGPDENFRALKAGKTGISMVDDQALYHEIFPAALVDTGRLEEAFARLHTREKHTRLEQLMMVSIEQALSQTAIDSKAKDTAFILSTTKGNVDLLEQHKAAQFEPGRELLWKLGQVIGGYFGNSNVSVLSNACISGVLAINTASMLIRSGRYKNVVVCGGDVISRFVVSGFMSFMALSPKPCKPFDRDRDGLSLGEAVGTVILSRDPKEANCISVVGGASANDANHISGPSRTGEGSFLAITKAFEQAGLGPEAIDHISAHGTATPYNDEMEAIVINRHHMEEVAVNSMKGYWGHSLGAAGVIETISLLWSMKNNILISSAGFEHHGLSQPLNVVRATTEKELNNCLKMASGFGGCNAALILTKNGNC